MTPSAEIRNAMLRLYASMSSGDARAVARLYSRTRGVLSIGTDPGEWWEGHAAIARVVKAQLREMGGIQFRAGDLRAFAEGTVGWAADRPTIRLPNGQALTFRLTTVFHQENGEWKIVQRHISAGASNADVVGQELTTQ